MRYLNIDIKEISELELLQQIRRGVLVTPNVDYMVKLQRDRMVYGSGANVVLVGVGRPRSQRHPHSILLQNNVK